MPKRVSKDQYYLNIAKEVASRSTCFRASHGAVIVREDQIISTGYVGAPRKTKDCFERGNCLRDQLKIPSGQRYELCRSVHAEQNAIINSARAAGNLLGAKMYIYSERLNSEGEKKTIDAYPCFICKKMILNSGLDSLVCQQADGSIKEHKVSDWAEQWQEHDLIDDMEQYGVNEFKGASNDAKKCSCC